MLYLYNTLNCIQDNVTAGPDRVGHILNSIYLAYINPKMLFLVCMCMTKRLKIIKIFYLL